jgi:uncharacterized membrane protein (UPF0136 family)
MAGAMIQTLALGVAAGYGVLALVGGIIGYVKANSRASLIAGGVSGLLLIGSAALAASHPVAGLAIACVVSVALVARFARGALTKRGNPVGYVMIGGGLAVLVTAGAALL